MPRWRAVPVDPEVLGQHARDVLPLIEQAFVVGDVEGAEVELAVAGQRELGELDGLEVAREQIGLLRVVVAGVLGRPP